MDFIHVDLKNDHHVQKNEKSSCFSHLSCVILSLMGATTYAVAVLALVSSLVLRESMLTL